ncbi:hypothetical protein [Treponema succinifaciens]|uniref:hypothetical protein n=1 Tax=Treponema succinifaciens TaxID=167 RepID=UPI003F7F20FE
MSEKVWSKEFLEYEDFIVNHPNYRRLPIEKSKDGKWNWIVFGKSELGLKRKEWAKQKGRELGVDETSDGFYAKVMLEIHPTKEKPCQICGKTMSLFYLYPNKNLVKSIKKNFKFDVGKYETIRDVCKKLIANGISEKTLINFLVKKCNLEFEYEDLETVICHCELKCRAGNSKMLGPGSMANFPDRFDGFHTYNRCCRAKEDNGRHSDNLKTYTRDRRAYEYFSDGNIQAANRFMKSVYFKGKSADHIIPVSLGGVHDPHYLQNMASGDNSSKRDRLVKEDILKAVEIEKSTKTNAVSWFVLDLWNFIKSQISILNEKNLEIFRNAMKQNMNDFLNVLYEIKNLENDVGIAFITEKLIFPKHVYFEKDYNFQPDGSYTEKERHITERASAEFERIVRLTLESLDEYHEKENRNLKPDFTSSEKTEIEIICQDVKSNQFDNAFSLLANLMKEIQKREIEFVKSQID